MNSTPTEVAAKEYLNKRDGADSDGSISKGVGVDEIKAGRYEIEGRGLVMKWEQVDRNSSCGRRLMICSESATMN